MYFAEKVKKSFVSGKRASFIVCFWPNYGPEFPLHIRTYIYSKNVTKFIIKLMRNTLLSSSDPKVCTKYYIKTVPPEKGKHCIVCETN